MRKIICFFFALNGIFSNNLFSTLAHEHEAYIKNVSREHLQLLSTQNDGTFLFSSSPNDSGTYQLFVIFSHTIHIVTFRHDDQMILQKTQTGHNSLACYRNYVAAVEDLVGEKEYYKSQSFGSVQIQFSNPVSESFKHKANQKIRAQEKIFKKQKWRKKVKIELEKLISSGNYKCEINSCFEKIIDLLLDPHYGYQDYKNDFKDALEYQKFLEITFHNYFC